MRFYDPGPPGSPGGLRYMMEMYTGWVQCDIGFAAPTTHFTMKSFLPVEPGQVRFYATTDPDLSGGIINHTVVASPGGIGPSEDEANIFAVDSADVSLEQQTFDGIVGSHLCLVLNARLGLLNCHMWHYAYSVLIKTNLEPNHNWTQSPIPVNQRPAGGASPDFGPVG
ncbi:MULTISPECIES: hypothetical protein [unclassified Streptomyces]|uniref:hypothetical protein n=1 Tax=unclassified Streptomyces TaxID=2593676 RepID=UPI00117C23BD|nr:hypothetical protein [Streptomyces sp. CB01883]